MTGGLLRATLALSAVELRGFFRDKRSLVFVLAFPVMLLVIFAAIFSGTVSGGGTTIPAKQLFMAGIIAAGVMSCGFQGLCINLVQERESGLVRRLASSPMPKAAYFIAKFVRVLVTTIIEVAILMAISLAFFGLPVPETAGRWLTLAWVIPLGAISCALVGMAYSAIVPSANAAAAVVTPVFMGLQFISGVFFPFSELPDWMQSLGALFPLKWMAQGLRSVFLPDALAHAEPAGAWELSRVAAVLALWIVIGLVITARTFKWRGPRVK
ncbi:ABC transporter [Luteipulveratus mongoliensis]|uniref:Transport permease protein n=1 Tax=Luteipulveratus mongoliensis TaxID=571913 RepID=A0A0K1JPQ3_9MICO|nr:ABC transporter [Luteipulveratus mongoliensis]